jgi:hypothetical protein
MMRFSEWIVALTTGLLVGALLMWAIGTYYKYPATSLLKALAG